MPFPETERVIYEKNPLNKVICQLRYPPILRIDSEVPSKFQDAIIDNFPLYNEKVEFQQTGPGRYEAHFGAVHAGSYVLSLKYEGEDQLLFYSKSSPN